MDRFLEHHHHSVFGGWHGVDLVDSFEGIFVLDLSKDGVLLVPPFGGLLVRVDEEVGAVSSSGPTHHPVFHGRAVTTAQGIPLGTLARKLVGVLGWTRPLFAEMLEPFVLHNSLQYSRCIGTVEITGTALLRLDHFVNVMAGLGRQIRPQHNLNVSHAGFQNQRSPKFRVCRHALVHQFLLEFEWP